MMKSLVHKKEQKPFDRYFLGIILLITIVGLFSFVSAALGVLAKSESKFYAVLFNQIVLGFIGGFIGLWITMHTPYIFWKKYAFYIFLATLVITILVFVPGLGFTHGGAQRWISIGPISFQPAELLKIGFIIYFATWLAWTQKKNQNLKFKILPLILMVGIVGGILLKQPDTKSLILIITAMCGMLFVSGIALKRIMLIIIIGTVGIVGLAFFRPYIMERIQTYINPSNDPRGSSYQIQQSLIAIGSGGVFGRGLGQSVQKFNYLPEPQGDSVFAVIGEEFGFFGTMLVVVLYVFFAVRGYKIAMNAPDKFSQYFVVGIITLITAQSFLNIVSLVGLFPLTGVPLVFISHGGTSLFIMLAAVGIVLNISRYQSQQKY